MAPRTRMTDNGQLSYQIRIAQFRDFGKTLAPILKQRHDQLLMGIERLKAFRAFKAGNQAWNKLFSQQDDIRARFNEADSDDLRARYETKTAGIPDIFGNDDVVEYGRLCEEFLKETEKDKEASVDADITNNSVEHDGGNHQEQLLGLANYWREHGIEEAREVLGTLGYVLSTKKLGLGTVERKRRHAEVDAGAGLVERQNTVRPERREGSGEIYSKKRNGSVLG